MKTKIKKKYQNSYNQKEIVALGVIYQFCLKYGLPFKGITVDHHMSYHTGEDRNVELCGELAGYDIKPSVKIFLKKDNGNWSSHAMVLFIDENELCSHPKLKKLLKKGGFEYGYNPYFSIGLKKNNSLEFNFRPYVPAPDNGV